jgi:hypothetical protein
MIDPDDLYDLKREAEIDAYNDLIDDACAQDHEHSRICDLIQDLTDMTKGRSDWPARREVIDYLDSLLDAERTRIEDDLRETVAERADPYGYRGVSPSDFL